MKVGAFNKFSKIDIKKHWFTISIPGCTNNIDDVSYKSNRPTGMRRINDVIFHSSQSYRYKCLHTKIICGKKNYYFYGVCSNILTPHFGWYINIDGLYIISKSTDIWNLYPWGKFDMNVLDLLQTDYDEIEIMDKVYFGIKI